jgi:hypothetical protein
LVNCFPSNNLLVVSWLWGIFLFLSELMSRGEHYQGKFFLHPTKSILISCSSQSGLWLLHSFSTIEFWTLFPMLLACGSHLWSTKSSLQYLGSLINFPSGFQSIDKHTLIGYLLGIKKIQLFLFISLEMFLHSKIIYSFIMF